MDERLHGLRVLLTTDAVGGVWTYSLDLARELGRNGIATVLAVLGPAPGTAAREAALAVPGLELEVTGLPLDWMATSEAEVLDAGAQLADMARQHGCRLVQLHSPALAAALAFDVPVVSVHHSCLATWWQAVKSPDDVLPEDFAWRRALVARGMAASDQVVAPTTAHAQAIAEAYGLSSPPLVIRNGRAPAPLHLVTTGEQPFFIFSSGRLWDDGKNFTCLAEAAGRIETPVFAAGACEGPGTAARDLSPLHLLGVLGEGELRKWHSLAAVYVSMALYEPFGLGVLEAAQAGCPLVLSDIPAHRELWSGAALFVPPREPAALATTLEALAADASLRERLGRRACYRATLHAASSMARETMRLHALRLALHRPLRERVA